MATTSSLLLLTIAEIPLLKPVQSCLLSGLYICNLR